MFRVGDEVVCVDDQPRHSGMLWTPSIVKGQTYLVLGLTTPPVGHPLHGVPSVVICGAPHLCPHRGVELGYHVSRFRKVQKRDIGEWLKQTATYDEEQHAPAPTVRPRKRERA